MRRPISATIAPIFAFSMVLIGCQVPIAQAQTTSATVVATCGTPPATYPAGSNRALTQDTTGTLCTAAGGGGGGAVNLTGINGVTPLVGTGATGTGSLRVTPASVGQASSSALAANQVVCAAACSLASFNVSADSTLSGAAWWVMIYNATSAPADGAVTPAKCYAASSGTTSLNGAFPSPATFTTGVVIGVSTTGCFTKTASTHAFISGDSR